MKTPTLPTPGQRATGGQDELGASPDTTGETLPHLAPWLIPAFGALIAFMTGVLWTAVL